MSKTLIVYYSWSGHTAEFAKQLQRLLPTADCVELKVPADTFSDDMYAVSDTAKQQMQTGHLPALTQTLPALTAYDLILVGGPVWSGSPATPVLSFLATVKTGQTLLAPFYTAASDPGNYEQAFQQAAKPRPTATGLGLASHQVKTAQGQMQQWLKQLNAQLK